MVLFGDIGTVFIMGLVGVAFTLPVVIIPILFGPKRPNPIKNAPFECGQVPQGAGKMHFMMQYYAYLLMFIVFDVLSMFLYAWAAAYKPWPWASPPTGCSHSSWGCSSSLWPSRLSSQGDASCGSSPATEDRGVQRPCR